MTTPILQAKGICKYFGPITALEDVDLQVSAGEVLGVIGDNGAGKSTLMKAFSGLVPASKGEIWFQGKPVKFHSPRDARNLGIEMVYQDLALAGNLPIAQNIYLGREPTKRFGFINRIDHKRCLEMSQEHLDTLKIHVKNAGQKVEDLSGGQRQAVAVARATAFDANLVIMDEPTAALAVKEVSKVLELIKRLKSLNVAVIIISHRMDDIFAVCDRVMALFHGKNFAEAYINETSHDELIGWVMGASQKRETV